MLPKKSQPFLNNRIALREVSIYQLPVLTKGVIYIYLPSIVNCIQTKLSDFFTDMEYGVYPFLIIVFLELQTE